MGKQIRFFMSILDEEEFLKKVKESKHFILNNKGHIIKFDEIQASNTLSLFISLPDSIIRKYSSGFIDSISSEVIQYTRCTELEGKGLRDGRIWAEVKFYDDNDQLTGKRKEFEEMYKLYEKWLRKNFKISKEKDYYIGSDALRLYREEGYIMVAGPKQTVEF